MRLGEEESRFRLGGLVIGAQGKEIADLLVEAFLRCPDFANPHEQLVEMVPAPRVLEPSVVDDEPFDQKLPQVAGGPLSKLDAARGANAVAHGEDQIEVVEENGAFYRAFPLGLTS